jgi:hypothetical protein
MRPVSLAVSAKGSSPHVGLPTETVPDSHRGEGECLGFQSIKLTHPGHAELVGEGWVTSCTEPAECSTTADLQEESPTDPGSWFVVKHGPTVWSCEGEKSEPKVRCTHDKHHYLKYRTRNLITILWDDGDVSPPTDYYSRVDTLSWHCG